jgi:hypothetical protein
MERRRELQPDEILTLPKSGREIAVVSEEQYLGALVELGRVQMFAGGVITSVLFRHPTDLPGEMVTVGAVLEWKDRTDAKPQPEPASPAREVEQTVREVEQTVREAGEQFAALAAQHADEDWREVQDAVANGAEIRVESGSLEAEESAPRDAVRPAPASDDGIDDGIEVDPNAVDESEIPEHLRA